MEISQYIKDLLLKHDVVVLNGFGSFTAKYKAAQIHEDTNTMSPPSKDVQFDSSSIVTTGLLEKQMASEENISVDAAEKQVAEYVKTVQSKLNAGKKVEFSELGSFTRIKEGVLLFTYMPTGNLLLTAYGLPKIGLPENLRKRADNTTDSEEEKKKGAWLWIVIPAAAALIVFTLFHFVPETKTKTLAFVSEKYNTIANKFKDSSNTDELISEHTALKDSVKTEIIKDTTTIAKDSTVNKKETYTPPVTNSDENSGQYKYPEKGKSYLIVSSLASAKEAEQEKRRFSKKGITTQIIPSGAGKYRLTLGIFDKISTAQTRYQDYHSTTGNEAWLWEYK